MDPVRSHAAYLAYLREIRATCRPRWRPAGDVRFVYVDTTARRLDHPCLQSAPPRDR